MCDTQKRNITKQMLKVPKRVLHCFWPVTIGCWHFYNRVFDLSIVSVVLQQYSLYKYFRSWNTRNINRLWANWLYWLMSNINFNLGLIIKKIIKLSLINWINKYNGLSLISENKLKILPYQLRSCPMCYVSWIYQFCVINCHSRTSLRNY